MAKESSFDVVSRADLNEVRNAVNMVQKDIATRYDFKKSVSSVTLEEEALVLVSDNEGKLRQVVDVLEEKLVRRKVPLKAVQYGKVEEALGGTVRQRAPIAQGIPEEKAKAMNKLLHKEETVKEAARKCPYCMGEIDPKATRCPHCTSQLGA